jgi:hypothetical protein
MKHKIDIHPKLHRFSRSLPFFRQETSVGQFWPGSIVVRASKREPWRITIHWVNPRTMALQVAYILDLMSKVIIRAIFSFLASRRINHILITILVKKWYKQEWPTNNTSRNLTEFQRLI